MYCGVVGRPVKRGLVHGSSNRSLLNAISSGSQRPQPQRRAIVIEFITATSSRRQRFLLPVRAPRRTATTLWRRIRDLCIRTIWYHTTGRNYKRKNFIKMKLKRVKMTMIQYRGYIHDENNAIQWLWLQSHWPCD